MKFSFFAAFGRSVPIRSQGATVSKRRHVWTAVFVALVGFCAAVHPAVYWRFYGWARAEPFWRGLPATYWRRNIERLNVQPAVLFHSFFSMDEPPPLTSYFIVRVVDDRRQVPAHQVYEWVKRATGLALPTAQQPAHEAMRGKDQSALPVLLLLLREANPVVRACAAQGLGLTLQRS
jgi:hypothetical protein